MKKRWLSILLACGMMLTMLPSTAFAEDGEPSECVCTEACTVETQNADCPICGAEDAAPEDCAQYETDQENELNQNQAQAAPQEGSQEEQTEEIPEEEPQAETQAVQSDKPVAVQATNAAHQHCYCGGNVSAGDHTSHSSVTYQPWDGKSDITSGYVYLTEDATINKRLDAKNLHLCLNGHTLSSDGGYKVLVNGTLTICDCAGGGTIQGATNTRDGNGGCVYVQSGTMNLYGGKLTGGNMKRGGAVALDEKSCVFNMYGGSISGNHATSGGGIYCTKGTVNLYGGSVSGNTATYGGGIHSFTSGTVNLYGGSVSENTANYGGGIYCNNGGTVNLRSGEIKQNSAVYIGGGIHCEYSGVVNLFGGKITQNKTTTTNAAKESWGGGIGARSGAKVTLSGGEISENKAVFAGNGIYLHGSDTTLTMSGGKISKNNTAANRGGGIYATGNATITLSDKAEISENAAKLFGGGIFLQGTGTTLTMSGGKINGNKSDSASQSNAGGGGISAWNGAKVTLSGGTISGNTVACAEAVGGGGIEVHNAVLEMSGGVITKNGARVNGGGILAIQDNDNQANTQVTITGGTISENVAEYAALYAVSYKNKRCILTVDGENVQITGNKSAGNGSAIHIRKGCDVTLGTATITGNAAGKSISEIIPEITDANGVGAVYISQDVNGTVMLTKELKVENNTGGNLYLESGKTITADALSGTAKIGVSTAKTPPVVFSTANNTDYSGYFFSDKDGYKVIHNSKKKLELKKGTTKTYSITVQSNNTNIGTVSASRSSASEGVEIILTATPKPGYRFQKWEVISGGVTIQNNKFTMPASDVTVKAIFMAKEYTICFKPDLSSSAFFQKTLYWTDKILSGVSDPTRKGYTFVGWMCGERTLTANTTYSDLAENDTVMSILVYAEWEKDTYQITYDLDGGTVAGSNPTSYDVETEDFTLSNPTKDGYTFVGWTGTALDGKTQTVTIAKGSTGDRSYQANWEKLHVCVFDQEVKRSEALKTPADCLHDAVYYKSCACGKISDSETFTATGTALGHDYGAWKSNGDGTHTRVCARDATHTEQDNCAGGKATCMERAICAVCGEAYGDLADHDFTAEVADEQYLKSEATCTEAAVYYKSCAVCGLASEETFVSGDPLGHNYSTEWSQDETHHWHVCNRCQEIGDLEGHTASKWITDTEATAKSDGEKHKECTVCGYILETGTIPATGSQSKPGKKDTAKPTKSVKTKAPKTGDNSNLTLWAALLCASGLGGTGVVLYHRKRKDAE